MNGRRREGKKKEIKLKNGRVGKEIKLVATLYTPALKAYNLSFLV